MADVFYPTEARVIVVNGEFAGVVVRAPQGYVAVTSFEITDADVHAGMARASDAVIRQAQANQAVGAAVQRLMEQNGGDGR